VIRQEINLFSSINQNKFGGVPVYIAHLAMSFEACGYAPRIIRMAKRDSLVPKSFTHGFPVVYMGIESCKALAESAPSILCTPTMLGDSKTDRFNPRVADFCEDHRVPVVIHDFAEFLPQLIERGRSGAIRVICIRERVKAQLAAMGVAATFLPHPYVMQSEWHAPEGAQRRRAGSCTRVDFRKKTEVLVQANLMLKDSPERRVTMHGALNRMYGHHILEKIDPNWMSMYRGTFPPSRVEALKLLSGYQLAFDLTMFKGGGAGGDGDGTQYAYLEAIEAGCTLVIHKEWIRTGKGEMQPDTNCLAVSVPEEVVELCRDDEAYPAIREASKALLAAHAPANVIPLYKEVMGL
jgi:hypothetical protein